MKKLVCELCGSSDFTKDPDGLFVCDFCRTKYTPQQAKSMMVEGTVKVDRSGEVENLIKLATSALDSQNPGEAYEYANRALEIDTNHVEAWIAKGKGAGWSSNLQNIRFTEMTVAFNSALDLLDSDSREKIKAELSDSIHDIGAAVYQLSLNHVTQFALAETWAEHVSRSNQVLAVLQTSYEWSGERKHLDLAIEIASSLIEGMAITTVEGPGRGWLAPEAEESIQNYIRSLSEKIRRHDSSYITPEPKSGEPACFVVTATMGSETAFPVVTLRQFRDSVLANSNMGKRFIHWYYKNGPKLAELVGNSPILRAISLVFIVAPATAVAWGTIKVGGRKLID